MDEQLAWYIGGPVLGLCVVALRWLLNERLGATRAWADAVAGRLGSVHAWLLVGLIAGGVVFGVLGTSADGYGWLTDTFTGGAQWVIVPVLVASGVLIGYGARLAGGCTSGNGLSGNAALSPAALVATGTFFGTAIVVSFAIEALL
ncbi:hypothetical protein C8N24_0431 [Solirubrobacter pauli]|uniref:Sulphur transport domain-containing protein n=1 Tax=Solirubrobacter pauli TaxID=166793 RepID=A0A660L7Y1_9ACTN|nr:hypothetical protein [Solirubrobacter pauli]RKQ90619.1 hypothetical protein C8N24_0431 [Solirubrobacter pauli]